MGTQKNKSNFLLTNVEGNDILDKLFRTTEMIETNSKKEKKLLTSDCECDNINKLSRETTTKKKILDN